MGATAPLDHVKVNCDVNFDPRSGSGGWGCILHDSDGDVVLESLQVRQSIAFREFRLHAIDAGVTHVIVEIDALAVAQAVYCNTYDLSAMANIVAELSSSLLSLNSTPDESSISPERLQ